LHSKGAISQEQCISWKVLDCFLTGLGVKKLRNKKQKGFTLIELLVVIAIIGLLASVVLLALNSARAKSRDAKRLADLRQVASALELYFNDNSSYPTAAAGAFTGTTWGQPSVVPGFIGLIPTAPTPADGTCGSTATNGSNTYYWYANNASAQTNGYQITFCLGAQTGGYSAGPHTLTPSGIQ
jgi:prepilin-type N-terminal cleavage/methylation domain-containing protein